MSDDTLPTIQANKIAEMKRINPTLQTAMIDEWHRFPDGKGSRLYGYVKGHPRIPDGYCTTSPINYFFEEARIAVTRNTIYILLERRP